MLAFNASEILRRFSFVRMDALLGANQEMTRHLKNGDAQKRIPPNKDRPRAYSATEIFLGSWGVAPNCK